MNNFDFVEDVLKKAKSSYDISEDKQLQQENIAALNSGDLVWIKHQYNESIEKYKKQINALSGKTGRVVVQQPIAIPDNNIPEKLKHITERIPAYIICRELQGETKERVLKMFFTQFLS
jgi:nucleoside diphosphate kinase